MRNILILTLLVMFAFISCKEEVKTSENRSYLKLSDQTVEYASGFAIKNHDTYKEIRITSPWPDAKDSFSYVLYPKGSPKPKVSYKASFIAVPIDKLVVTSTTDIPMLEFLELEEKLVGFPHTDYISSEKTRVLIDSGKVKELGNQGNLNTELTLELAPDLIIGYSATGDTKTYDLIERTGIPVVLNGSWTEQHPLGRAEWIKFVAAFFGKEKEADQIFRKIETDYLEAIVLAKNISNAPTVLSGNMYKDIWHVPGGDSYVAQFLKDANTNYLWAETANTGSIALSFESVLEKGKNADLWIGSGSSTSLEELKSKNHQYELFDAFKNKTVYSSTLKKGAKGGLLFYELGPMRPDLILKDIIHIAHPEVLTNYEPYFFEKLN